MVENDKLKEGQMARIRALLARTTANGCTEAEAQAAAAMVDKLMAQYEIDLDEVMVRSSEVVQFDIRAAAHNVRYTCKAIAKFCDAEVWMNHPDIHFVALEIDTEIAEYLVVLFMLAIDRESMQFVSFNPDYAMKDAVGRRTMVDSFEMGMASRLSERLTHMKSSRDFTQRQGGFDLVVSKGALVKQAMGVLGITLGKARGGKTIGDRSAYAAGQSAGNGVSINQGVRGSSSAAAGRIR